MDLNRVNKVIFLPTRYERLKSKQLFRTADKVVPSADWGDGKIETENRPQPFTPNGMLQGSDLSVTSSTSTWQLLPSDRAYSEIDCEISLSIFANEGVPVSSALSCGHISVNVRYDPDSYLKRTIFLL